MQSAAWVSQFGCDYTASFNRKGKIRPLKQLEKNISMQEVLGRLGKWNELSDTKKFLADTDIQVPYSYKFWRGFNLAMDQNDFFGVDLIWRWTKFFLIWRGFNLAVDNKILIWRGFNLAEQ